MDNIDVRLTDNTDPNDPLLIGGNYYVNNPCLYMDFVRKEDRERFNNMNTMPDTCIQRPPTVEDIKYNLKEISKTFLLSPKNKYTVCQLRSALKQYTDGLFHNGFIDDEYFVKVAQDFNDNSMLISVYDSPGGFYYRWSLDDKMLQEAEAVKLQTKLLSTTDAEVWADEFTKVVLNLNQTTTLQATDFNELAFGWFANAIEVAKQFGYLKGKAEGANSGFQEGYEEGVNSGYKTGLKAYGRLEADGDTD